MFHYLSCLWVLKYRYLVVVVSWPLDAVCRDLGRCSWSTAFAGGLFISPPPTHPLTVTVTGPSPALCRPSGDYRYRPARHHVTMLWRDSTKLECRADPRSEWLNRLKRRLSSGSVVTRGFESRPDIFGLQTVLVELRYPTTLYREGGGRVAGLGRVISYTSQKLSIGGTYFSQCKTWRIRVRWISR